MGRRSSHRRAAHDHAHSVPYVMRNNTGCVQGYIGTAPGSTITAGSSLPPATPSPADSRPIVWYGTSILQGGVAARAAQAYSNVLTRRLGRVVLNFGFAGGSMGGLDAVHWTIVATAGCCCLTCGGCWCRTRARAGNGKMELDVASYLTTIDAAAFIIDCNPNLDAEEIAERTQPLVKCVAVDHKHGAATRHSVSLALMCARHPRSLTRRPHRLYTCTGSSALTTRPHQLCWLKAPRTARTGTARACLLHRYVALLSMCPVAGPWRGSERAATAPPRRCANARAAAVTRALHRCDGAGT